MIQNKYDDDKIFFIYIDENLEEYFDFLYM